MTNDERNPKSEFRSPKEVKKPKPEIRKPCEVPATEMVRGSAPCDRDLDRKIRLSVFRRASEFGFRISFVIGHSSLSQPFLKQHACQGILNSLYFMAVIII